MEYRAVMSIYEDEDKDDEEIWRGGRREEASVGNSVQCLRFQKKVRSSIYFTLLYFTLLYFTLLFFSYHDAASPKLPSPFSCKLEYVTLQGWEERNM